MRPTATNVTVREVINHLVNGAGLGTFLAFALIVANSTVLGAIVQSTHPKLAVLTLVLAVASPIAVGSAISGFIMSALDRS